MFLFLIRVALFFNFPLGGFFLINESTGSLEKAFMFPL